MITDYERARYERAVSLGMPHLSALAYAEDLPGPCIDMREFPFESRRYRGRPWPGHPRRAAPRLRDPSEVTGIVLHQTATDMPPERWRARRYGRETALGQRYARVAVQMVAGPEIVALTHEPLAFLHSANGANASTASIEIVGRFPGTPVTPGLVANAIEGIVWLVELLRAEGCELRWVYAHRQFSASRRNDPGVELWSTLAPVCMDLGLAPRTEYAHPRGGGRGIPAGWWRHDTVRDQSGG